MVLLSGVLAVLSFGNAANFRQFDQFKLTAPFGYFGNLLVSPLARWDSAWYLAIAQGGYDHNPERTTFFPLYPVLVRGLGTVLRSNPGQRSNSSNGVETSPYWGGCAW